MDPLLLLILKAGLALCALIAFKKTHGFWRNLVLALAVMVMLSGGLVSLIKP